MASMNLASWVRAPWFPIFKNKLNSLKCPFLTISDEKKSNSARGVKLKWPIKVSSANELPAGQLELTVKNVDLVLEQVRPYLIADGGNVDVLSVEDGVVYLQLQGACGSCPSSTTTMKMGIERVLNENFGDAIKEIQQVNGDQLDETTVEAVNRHLDILRPAIKNYGGDVDVIAIVGGDCTVRYQGPQTIGSGIKAAIKEKFPNILNVVFTTD